MAETPETKKASQKEFEKKVTEIAKKGFSPSQIGEELKKEEIHPREYSKKIGKILSENNMYEDPDIKNLKAKLERIKKHASNNSQDKKATREKVRIFSQIRRLKKYRKLI